MNEITKNIKSDEQREAMLCAAMDLYLTCKANGEHDCQRYWEAFMALHRSRSADQVRRMEHRMGLR